MLSDATVLFKDETNTILSLENQNTNGSRIDVLLSNLKDCIIILEKKDVSLSAVHIKNADRCVIYGGTIEGSVLMYGLTNSTLIVGCHQVSRRELRTFSLADRIYAFSLECMNLAMSTSCCM